MRLSLEIIKERFRSVVKYHRFGLSSAHMNLTRPIFYSCEAILNTDTLYISTAASLPAKMTFMPGSSLVCIDVLPGCYHNETLTHEQDQKCNIEVELYLDLQIVSQIDLILKESCRNKEIKATQAIQYMTKNLIHLSSVKDAYSTKEIDLFSENFSTSNLKRYSILEDFLLASFENDN